MARIEINGTYYVSAIKGTEDATIAMTGRNGCPTRVDDNESEEDADSVDNAESRNVEDYEDEQDSEAHENDHDLDEDEDEYSEDFSQKKHEVEEYQLTI